MTFTIHLTVDGVAGRDLDGIKRRAAINAESTVLAKIEHVPDEAIESIVEGVPRTVAADYFHARVEKIARSAYTNTAGIKATNSEPTTFALSITKD